MKKKNDNAPINEGEHNDLSFSTSLYGEAHLLTSTYRNGEGLAVEVLDQNGELIATLSVNIPERSHLLGEREFFAKTWSENEQIAEDALASGIFHDTGRRSDENLNAQIWKLI